MTYAVTVTVTVTPHGAGGATGAVVTDDLSEVLDDAMWNDDVAAGSGAVERGRWPGLVG